MKRLIEILLISTLLFTFAFFAGCKDKAEAVWDGDIYLKGTERPPEALIYYYDGGKRIEYIPRPEPNEPNEIIVLKGMRHAWQEEGWNRIDYEPQPEPNEPNEPITSIHISMISDDFEEFNKIYIGTDSEIKEALLKDGVIAKPNEPDEIATKIYEGQKFRYKDRLYIFDSERFILNDTTTEPTEPEIDGIGPKIEIIYKCPRCGYDFHSEPEPNKTYSPIYDRALSAEEIAEIDNRLAPEPNEPEEGSILVETDTGDYVWMKPTKFRFGIPTWPDYIELDKDLIIESSHKNDPNNPLVSHYDVVLEKGTRIYFTEDE